MPQPLIQIFVRALPMITYGWVKLPYGTVITYFVYLYFAMLGMVPTAFFMLEKFMSIEHDHPHPL